MPITRDELARAALLGECTDDELDELAAGADELALAPGELLFGDDDQAREVWVLLDGELVISKQANGHEVTIDRLAPGAYLGEISLLTGEAAGHRARAVGPARLARIGEDTFYALLHACDAVSHRVLRTMAERVRRTEHLLQQHERMAGLGTLAAGLAHELNNPAAAATRAIAGVRERLAEVGPLARRLAAHDWTEGEVGVLRQLEEATQAMDVAAHKLDPLDRSDREELLANWLDAHGVERTWELASLLVDHGITPEKLDGVARGCGHGVLGDALAWTAQLAGIAQLLDEAGQSAQRISEMVRAIKAYSYVDTTTRRAGDVHEGIEQSLTMLAPRLREAKARLERSYDRALPPLESYGTELNQVWTNLLDNAADAVAAAGGGAVRVETRADGDDGLVVDVVDAGGGVPSDVAARIFEPFFTTKPRGKGTGLGLEIVQRIVTRHHGTIELLQEQPGETRFRVRLPFHHPAAT